MRSGQAQPPDDRERRASEGLRGELELDPEREFLLRSLDDLEVERAAGDIDEKDYLELRDAYTARAAEVMRAIELSPTAVDEGEDRPVRRRRMQRAVAAATLVVLVAVGAGALVASMAGERTPGQQVSGSIAGTQAELLAQARNSLSNGKALDAVKAYDAVLRSDPQNAEALAYRGWVLKLAGLPDKGLESIDRAIAADPSYPDAHFFRGMILKQDKLDPAGAVKELRLFLASNPTGDLVPMVQQVLDQALRESGEQAQ
jgi:tetratricopeptide (TPR) repeat protein